jgi:hypothetical protein
VVFHPHSQLYTVTMRLYCIYLVFVPPWITGVTDQCFLTKTPCSYCSFDCDFLHWSSCLFFMKIKAYSTTWCFCYKTLLSDISESQRNNITTVICWCFLNMIPAFTTPSTFLYNKQDVIWWCSTHIHSCTQQTGSMHNRE